MRFSLRKNRIRAMLLSAVMLAVLAPATRPSAAADIRVYSSGAPSEVARHVAATFSATAGHRVLLTVGAIGEIQKRLLAGETPDLVVLPAPAIEALDQAGKLRSDTRTVLARVGIGVAVREGARAPDIATADAVRKMLIEARSVVHADPAGGGFAGAQIARMMARLGIAEAVKPKTSLMSAIGGGTAAVAKGEADIGLFNISEIIPAKGVTLVGPLPPDLQSYIVFAGAVHAASTSPDTALAFLQALSDPNARDAWQKGGFEPPGP